MSERRQHAWQPGAALAVLAACLIWGCAKFEPAEGPEQPQAGDAADSADAEPALLQPTDIELKAVDRASYDATLGDMHGNVVLVDFWATWCGPCLEQLPHSTALADELRGEGLVVVMMSMDDPDEVNRVKAVLAARGGAATVNLISAQGGGSPSMTAFEIAGGALPHYKLYDRDGNLARTFALDPSADEQFTREDIAAAVRGLLASENAAADSTQ